MGDLFSGPHIILIALVVLLLFGGKKIPELMRGLGKGVREFKEAKDNVSNAMSSHINDERSAATDREPATQVSSNSATNN